MKVETTSRTNTSIIKLSSSDPQFRILQKLCRQTKHLYNTSNYCQRSWFQLQQAFIKHVASNVNRYQLTQRDLLLAIKSTFNNHALTIRIVQQASIEQLLTIAQPEQANQFYWPIVYKRILAYQIANSFNQKDQDLSLNKQTPMSFWTNQHALKVITFKANRNHVKKIVSGLTAPQYTYTLKRLSQCDKSLYWLCLQRKLATQVAKTAVSKLKMKSVKPTTNAEINLEWLLHSEKELIDLPSQYQQFIQNMKVALNYKISNRRTVVPEIWHLEETDCIPTSFIGGEIGDVYTRLFNKQVYQTLPSQAAQYATTNSINDAYKSYFTRAKLKHQNNKPPGYADKKGFKPVAWKKTTFRFKSRGSGKKRKAVVCLSLGQVKKGKEMLFKALANDEFSLKANVTSGTPTVTTKKYYRTKTAGAERCKYNSLELPISSDIYKKKQLVQLVRIVPKQNGNSFELHITIEKPKVKPKTTVSRIMSIDPGVVNVVAATTNVSSLRPWIVSGKEIVATNERFVSALREAYSQLKISQDKSTSKRISQLYQQRKNILKDIFHQLSRRIVNYAIQHGINKIVIGYNKNWKRRSRLGGSMNRIYNQIPFATLVKYIFHKGEEAGIIVVENEESYTSKCDALALESFEDCKHRTTNRRLVRGLYRSSIGRLVNAERFKES